MKLYKPHIAVGMCVVCLAALLCFQTAVLAQSRTHNLGDYKLRIDAGDELNTNDSDPTGEWPQDHYRYGTIVFYNSGHAVGQWALSALDGYIQYSRIVKWCL